MSVIKSVLTNLLLLYVAYFVCRITFFVVNISAFVENITFAERMKIYWGGFVFDSAAIFYTNALYLVLVFLPFHLKEREWWNTMLRWLFVIVNAICIVANMADVIYYNFVEHRASAIIFQEFENESNIGKIVGTEMVNHWGVVLLGVAMILCLALLTCRTSAISLAENRKKYYIRQTCCLVVTAVATVFFVRGMSFTTATRPLAVNDAHSYTKRVKEAAIVVNTPFSIIRTWDKKPPRAPQFFTADELDKIYTPIHTPNR